MGDTTGKLKRLESITYISFQDEAPSSEGNMFSLALKRERMQRKRFNKLKNH